MDIHTKHIKLCDELRDAIDSKNWGKTKNIALELEKSISENLKNLKHTDGVYKFGFQIIDLTPGFVKKAMAKYHATLDVANKKTKKYKKKGKSKK